MTASSPLVDWSTIPDDPDGYMKLRATVDASALQLDELRLQHLGDRLREAQGYATGSSPSEWMGEIALLKEALAAPALRPELRTDIVSTIDAIRAGFRGVGGTPPF